MYRPKTLIYYQPEEGFLGEDSFMMTLAGGNSPLRTLRFDITVKRP